MDDNTCSDILELKCRLKEWEHNFKQVNGRVPGKADIKGNKAINELYHKYNSKKKQASRKSEPLRETCCNSVLPCTPQKKKKRKIDICTPPECPPTTSPNIDRSQQENKPSSPVITSIGPTPQKCGSILGIFDVVHIEVTPVKKRQPSPSPQGEDDISVAPESPSQSVVQVSPVQQNKVIIPINPETPTYLRMKKLVSSSPSSSPLKPRKPLARSLSDMIAEMEERKELDPDEIWIDDTGQFIDTVEDIIHDLEDSPNEETTKDQDQPTRRGRKIKRKTKMHIFRDVGHGTSMETQKDDDILVRDVDNPGTDNVDKVKSAKTKTKMINPNALSHQNFRRLKIQKGKQRFGQRRR